MQATRHDGPRGRGEELLVSCQPLSGLFEEVERRGLHPTRLLGGLPYSLDFLRQRRNRIPWEDFRTVIDNLAEHYSDAEIVDIGRHLVHTEAQRPFALIARRFLSVTDFYRSVFSQRSGWGRPMFPCMTSTFAPLDVGLFEVTVTLHEGFTPSHSFPLITEGNIIGLPEVLHEPPAQVTVVVDGSVARFEIIASSSSNRLSRLRRRLTLPFRANDMAAELQDAHGSLRSRYDALQSALDDHKRMAHALNQSETRLRLMLDAVEMSVWDWDLPTGLVRIDESGQKALGISGSEHPLATVLEVIHDDDRETMVGLVRESVTTGQFRSGPCRIIRDGEVRTIEARGHVFSDPLGEPIRVVGVLQDKTEELRQIERQAHFGQVVSSSPFEIYVASLDDLQFVDVNQVASENLGYSREELRALTPAAISAPEPGQSPEEVLAPLLAGETEKVIARYRHRRKNGSTYPVDLILQTSMLDSQPVLVAIGIDVSDRTRAEERRRELENQLWQAQKLEALGTMAGGITHDFNNLLHVIIGFTELAADTLPAESEATGHLRYVLRAAGDGQALAEQILTFSRPGDGSRSNMELGSVVRDALALVDATLPARTVVHRQLATQGCVIRADAAQIGQVVTNLCTNAAHALGEAGGPIDVTVERCETDAAELLNVLGLEPGPHACLTVADQGSGMSPDVLERIFDPFFTTKDHGGTGLGLAVVHSIVGAHGGVIDVESDVGSGTTMRVFLPCSDETVVAVPAADRGPLKGGGRVLVVDDVAALAAMVGQGLEKLGYDVQVVPGSTAALEAFEADPDSFDAVVTDQSMPELSGLELAERLRELRDDLPIALISGLGPPASERELEQIGVREVLTKPFSIADLGEALARMLRT